MPAIGGYDAIKVRKQGRKHAAVAVRLLKETNKPQRKAQLWRIIAKFAHYYI